MKIRIVKVITFTNLLLEKSRHTAIVYKTQAEIIKITHKTYSD